MLRRHCTASTLIRPCPTPALAAACRDVEAATLAHDGSPPITRTTIPTCRAHYPGGSSGCACRLLPHSCSLPQMAGGSASALSLSRPAQASHMLRPTGSLSRPRRPLSRGSSPSGHPAEPPVSYQINRQFSGWISPPQGDLRLRGALPFPDLARDAKKVACPSSVWVTQAEEARWLEQVPPVSFCEMFGVVQFSTLATPSANR